MRTKVTKGSRIKLTGPASFMLLDGEVEVHGSPVKRRERIGVPVGRTIIMNVIEDSILEVNLGDGGSIEEFSETSLPYEWKTAAEQLVEMEKPATILILGGIDGGKSVFANYLLNLALKKGLKTVLIDTDLGQSEIGAPTTISMTSLRKPLPYLNKARMTTGFFVGSTSPERLTHRVLIGLKMLYEEALKQDNELIIINTDGWIEGEKAVEYKVSMVLLVKPNVIVAIERESELEPIVGAFDYNPLINLIRLPPLPAARRRSPDERRITRQGMYLKYFENSKIRTYSLLKTRFLYTSLSGCVPLYGEELMEIKRRLGEKGEQIEWIGRNSQTVIIVSKSRRFTLNEEEERIIREILKSRTIRIVPKGYERGLLVGLLNERGLLQGLGIITEIDWSKGLIRIKTPFEGKVHAIAVGNIRLDGNLNEVEKIKGWAL